MRLLRPEAHTAVVDHQGTRQGREHRPARVKTQPGIGDIEKQLHCACIPRARAQAAAPDETALAHLPCPQAVGQPGQQAVGQDVGEVLVAIARIDAFDAHQQLHVDIAQSAAQGHIQPEQGPRRALLAGGAEQTAGKPQPVAVPVQVNGTRQLTPLQGLSVDRRKVQRDIRAIQHDAAMSGPKMELSRGALDPRRPAPGVQREALETATHRPAFASPRKVV